MGQQPVEGIYFTSGQWKSAGRPLNTLRKRVDSGTTLELRPGVFRDADRPPHNHEEIIVAYLGCLALNTPTVGVIGAAAAALWNHPDLYNDTVDIGVEGTIPTRLSARVTSPDVRLVAKAGWFDRPRRFVERSGVLVLRPEWIAVDLLERRIGDRDHVRQFLDHAERTGQITAGSLVAPLAELIAPRREPEGTLTTDDRAIIVQLAGWTPDATPGPIDRHGLGTDLSHPPVPGSDDERALMNSTRGYWVLDAAKAAQRPWLIAARRGRTLAVFRVGSGPHAHGSRYWFEVAPETDSTIVEAFVGTEGRTFKPSRNPIRYWPA